jgi:hypothetical protein
MDRKKAIKFLKYLHKKEGECRGDLLRQNEASLYAEIRAKFLNDWRGQK